MITLAAPCEAMADREPLTVGRDDLISDVSEQIKDVHYRAAVAIDAERRPIGLLTRSDLVAPKPRRVILVDHAEAAQSVPGVEQAEIVEILDHHHIGSIETSVPVAATFDPVGSTATLVVERFRQTRARAGPLDRDDAALRGPLRHGPAATRRPTTERDRAVVEYLEEMLDLEAMALGREMFEATSDVSDVPPRRSSPAMPRSTSCRAARRSRSPRSRRSARGSWSARDELRRGDRGVRERNGYALAALMVTDILERGTDLLVCGDVGRDRARVRRTATATAWSDLPGVMSRKKQVAPLLLGAM